MALEKKLIQRTSRKRKKNKSEEIAILTFWLSKLMMDKTILSERKGKGIWQGLYQFPLIESDQEHQQKRTCFFRGIYQFISTYNNFILFNKKEIVHKLSHQHLYTQFWIVEV